MFNQLLKITLFAAVWVWLKPRWRGLLALTVFVVMVHVLHGEYLSYVTLSDDRRFLVISYAIKWLALITGVLVYLFFSLRSSGSEVKSHRQDRDQPVRSVAERPDDGFDFLRDKKRLENRADKVLSDADKR
ncbi:MAG: hypothetical protein AAGA91_11725 [Pseudomonadota bacterium]